MSDIIFKTLLLKGENGDNIKDIKKTSTNGLVDTYTVTLNNGDTTTFKVTNGKSIVDIKKTGSTGLVDTYTITYNDGTTSTFTITNGKDGKDGGITVDDALSETSKNPVQNKVITNSINDVRGQIHTNLLNPTAPTQTIRGVTLTNNGDGSYTVDGTATDSPVYFLLSDGFTDLDLARKYKIVGCPQGGSENTYSLYDDRNSSSRDTGNGVVYTPTNQPKLYIRIIKGVTVNNLLFKPMLTTDLNATYDDFVPYTGDSGRLNEDVANLVKGISPITNTDIDTILNS